MQFQLHSEYKPTGDQPQAIEKLTEGLNIGETYSVYNTMGAMLVNAKANSTVEKVELNNSGVYIVQVGNVVRKIVK